MVSGTRLIIQFQTKCAVLLNRNSLRFNCDENCTILAGKTAHIFSSSDAHRSHRTVTCFLWLKVIQMYIHFQIHFIKIKSNKNQIVCRVHIGSRLHNKTMTLSHKYGYFSLCRQHHSCCQVSSIKPCQADIFY